MKTIARNATKLIGEIKNSHTNVRRFDPLLGKYFDATMEEAFGDLDNFRRARLVRVSDTEVRINVHGNKWFVLTVPAPAEASTTVEPTSEDQAPAPAAPAADDEDDVFEPTDEERANLDAADPVADRIRRLEEVKAEDRAGRRRAAAVPAPAEAPTAVEPTSEDRDQARAALDYPDLLAEKLAADAAFLSDPNAQDDGFALFHTGVAHALITPGRHGVAGRYPVDIDLSGPEDDPYVMTVAVLGEFITSEPFNARTVGPAARAMWAKIKNVVGDLDDTQRAAVMAARTANSLHDRFSRHHAFVSAATGLSESAFLLGTTETTITAPAGHPLTVTYTAGAGYTLIATIDGDTYTSEPYDPKGPDAAATAADDLFERIGLRMTDAHMRHSTAPVDAETRAALALDLAALADEKIRARKRRTFISTAAGLTESAVLSGATETTITAPAGHPLTVTYTAGTGYTLTATIHGKTYTSEPYGLDGPNRVFAAAGNIFDRITIYADDTATGEQHPAPAGGKSNLWSVTSNGQEIIRVPGHDHYEARVSALAHPHVRDAEHAAGIELHRVTHTEASSRDTPLSHRFVGAAHDAVERAVSDQRPATIRLPEGLTITGAGHATSDGAYVLVITTLAGRMIASDAFPREDVWTVAAHLFKAITAPSTREEFAAPDGPFDPAEAAARVERQRTVFLAEGYSLFRTAYDKGLPTPAGTVAGYPAKITASGDRDNPYRLTVTVAGVNFSDTFQSDTVRTVLANLWASIRTAIDTPSSATHAAARAAAGRR